ncbi:TauD/TfdA family dioxygenase [Paenibacillus lycopersici]|uniref:Alpha-ketoglutarate-dependent sulfate ester dioxygenase n=1 Tax=Paenibacillus lycopersici TaxID=2704462 RepID=A0A6C0G2J2_9BACL|nr:TauD/TfdA family dioxygenase [Paenibacillus lycopersici]QHT63596.1 TauD/TfdA family dioxygenase [Paenibacillus lycopersici]
MAVTVTGTKEWKVERIAGRLGAQVSGARLSGELDDASFEAIYELLLAHKVLFFRGQQHLTNEEQEQFAKRFGNPVAHPTVPAIAGTDYTLELDSDKGDRANSWHTDVTFQAAYPKISILRGVSIPESGGDTVWADTHAAYHTLPVELKQFAERLWAIHSNDYDYVNQRYVWSENGRKHFEEVFTSKVYETEHPLVHVHPETGEKHLLLGHFFKRFIGYNTADSEDLYRLFQRHITQLENTVRWRWQAGDVVIWDNRATQHYAVNDYGSAKRVVRRVTIDGEIPVSLSERRSVTREVGKKK